MGLVGCPAGGGVVVASGDSVGGEGGEEEVETGIVGAVGGEVGVCWAVVVQVAGQGFGETECNAKG